MNFYNIFKPVSLFFFSMLAFIGSNNAFAVDYTANFATQEEAYTQRQSVSCSGSQTYEFPMRYWEGYQGIICGTGSYAGCYEFRCGTGPGTGYGSSLTWAYRFNSFSTGFDSSGLPTSTQPDISECTATGGTGFLSISGDASLPSTIWQDGCQYEKGFSTCTTSDSWITKDCVFDIGVALATRDPDPTCTPQNPCSGNAPVGEAENVDEIPTQPQTDTAAEGEQHPDYDLPSNTQPDVTQFDPQAGSMNMTVETSDSCTHAITISPDGTITENVTGTDCQVIIFDNRDFGTDNITYTNPANQPAWSLGTTPGNTGSTGNTDSTGGTITPTPNSNDVDINTDDTPDTTCDPATQDCEGLNTGLLSDIKELLSFDDQTVINQAATDFDTNLQGATDDLEQLGSQEIDIDGFNIDTLVKNVLKLPTAPPNNNDTFTLSANFHLGNKKVEITDMYNKLSMLREFLKWVFWITAAFSVYKILFTRPLM